MGKYNIKILNEAKDDIKEIIIYIKTKLKEPEVAKQLRIAFKEEISKLKDTKIQIKCILNNGHLVCPFLMEKYVCEWDLANANFFYKRFSFL